MKLFYKILSIVIFALLCLPALYHILGFKEINPLGGAYVTTKAPSFAFKKWNNNEFQKTYERFVEDHIGFRPQFIRFTNQINYTLFNEFNPQGVIIGKQNYLYEIPYLRAKAGKDYVGIDSLACISRRIIKLRNELEKTNTKLLVIIAPDKVSFMPEYIPEKYSKQLIEDSINYDVFKELLINDSIAHIDFNKLFLNWKDSASYPLFTKYGTHWSTYGSYLALDTIIQKIEYVLDTNLNNVYFGNIEVTNVARDTDYDIAEFLNLLYKLPDQAMGYPKLLFDTLHAKPNVLVIGDSFYTNIANSTLPENVFTIHDFLFYNKRVHGNSNKVINLPEDYKNYDIVILEGATVHSKKIGYGILDNLKD